VAVGILALQGNVLEHAASLRRVGAEPRSVRRPSDLEGCSALVLPSGESTTMSMLLDSSGLRQPLMRWVAEGRPTFGTCAGLVLLADEVLDGRDDQEGLGGLDVAVRRNGYGRQRFSFEAEVDLEDGAPMLGVFIRAPRIEAVGPGVEVLATLEGEPVAVASGAVVACSFHPELAEDDRLHRRLVALG
jgi:pyridoxal 5'-phosphate synthase pdxT subunit